MSLLLAATLSLFLAGCQGISVQLEHEPVLLPQIYPRRGLQSGVLYQYKYTGTVSTWISEDPTQFSGSALRADLELERTQDGNIRVKARNVEVAEINEKTSCHVQEHTDFSYHPMDQADAALLEQPFLIQIDEATVLYIKVPDEPLWVTNVRRGIINSLPLSILTGHSPSRLTFRLTEDTMIGQCYNWYSQLKLASYQADLENKEQERKIEEDVQRYAESERYTHSGGKGSKTKKYSKTRKTSSKTSTKKGTKTGGPSEPPMRLIQPINDTLWILTRTLDDEGCEENHFTVKINGNHESVERTQRSSEGTFLIRGEQGAVVRLERAEVNGDIVVYTGGCEDKFIRTTSKQVLELRAVRHAEVHVEFPQEMERKRLSFQTEEGPRLFTVEEQLTGIYPTDPQIQATVARIKEDLTLLAVDDPEHSKAFLDTFLPVVERIAVLSKPEIENLASQLPDASNAKTILYQALLTSGTNEALTYLLEKMRDTNFRIENHAIVFRLFQEIAITIKDPSLIPDLLDVVSRMREDNVPKEVPIATTSLLSVAKLAHQYCLNPQTAESCDPRCDTDAILSSFLPVLSHGLRDPLKWKQLVHLQAMCTLGTPHIIPYLEPIIQGKNNDDIDLRISAIYCLTADLQPKTVHSMAMDILVPLMNNPTEFPDVRNIAFLTITTWEPTNLSWWEHVALSTWRENSTQVAAFISTTLTSLTEVKDPRSVSAKKVIHLAKHPNKMETYSLSRSAYFYLDEIMKNCRDGTNVRLAWLSSTQSVFPRTVFYTLQITTVMGMSDKEMAVYFGNVLQELYKNYYPTFLKIKEGEDSETFFGIFEELQEHLEISATSFIQRELFTLLSFFEPVHTIFMTISGEIFGSPLTQTTWISALHLPNYVPVNFRSAYAVLAFPSDLGLPVIVKHEEDFAAAIGRPVLQGGLKVSIKVDHRNSVNVKTLVPWTEGQAAGAGLEAKIQIILPVHFSEIWSPTSAAKLLLPTSETNIATWSSFMYTSLTPLFPFTGAALIPDEASTSLRRKVVWRGEVLESRTKAQLLEKLGISMTCEWSGDFQPAGNLRTAFRELNPYQLHYHNHEARLVFDPRNSLSKSITFTWDIYIKRTEKITQSTDEQFSQVSQGAADYEFMSQVSGSSDSEIFGQTSNGGFGFDGQDAHTQSQTVTTHMQRVEEQIISLIGGDVYTISFTIEPDTGPRKYEFAFTLATNKQQKIGVKTPMKFHLTFVNSSVTEIFADKHWTCFDVRLEAPYLTPLLPKEVVLESDLSEKVSVSMYTAEHCHGSPTLQIEVHQVMSPTALTYVVAEAERKTCDGSYPHRLLPLYDNKHLVASGDQDLLNAVVAIQNWVTDNLGLKVVDIIRDRVQQPDNIIADAVLNLKTNEWNLSITGLHETSVYSVPNYDPTEILGISFVQNYMFDAISNSLDKSCYLTQHSVRTFDGLVHEFEPTSCWTTASINIPANDLPGSRSLQFAIQARYLDDLWEVRLSWPFSALILDITRSEILVNEEPFSGQSDKFVVHSLQDSQLVEAGMFLIWVGDTVQIRVSDLYYGEVAGLCGNYDSEPSNDMKGPLGCLYTDPALHTTAWSTPALGCSRLTLRSKKAKVAEFRETCDNEVFQPTGITQHNVMENCTVWEYHERTSPAGLYCHSRVPIPVCLPWCEASLTFTSNLKYDCFQSSSSQGQQQQQQQDSSSPCVSKVLPATIPSGCFHQ